MYKSILVFCKQFLRNVVCFMLFYVFSGKLPFSARSGRIPIQNVIEKFVHLFWRSDVQKVGMTPPLGVIS